jgi:hypothetical protein
MRNMMHDDVARWLVQAKIKWGAHNSHEMITPSHIVLIQFASFNLDNSEMMPMMHDNVIFENLMFF